MKVDFGRKRNRLIDYDYSKEALYFVTICVKNMFCVFGDVVNDEMIPNELGQIVNVQFFWLTMNYPYIEIHSYIVMPNHVHCVIEINKDLIKFNENASTDTNAAIQEHKPSPKEPKIRSLSQLMGAYKSTISKQIHDIGHADFAWHRSFYDHIIRNEESLYRIINYIETNPLRWKEDKFYKE